MKNGYREDRTFIIVYDPATVALYERIARGERE